MDVVDRVERDHQFALTMARPLTAQERADADCIVRHCTHQHTSHQVLLDRLARELRARGQSALAERACAYYSALVVDLEGLGSDEIELQRCLEAVRNWAPWDSVRS
jgi:hypothetical protein